ncbi:sensor domain-containing diguanylate cyclase [Polynucleobacter sp. AM-25C3]|uniref:bifunctional diguanylate cyclase/phosphodiesterase n=1 Tax=Polynucleobacter sp. AM-25C3 TaxID=1855569 RepID=UPI001C0B194A|nr:sensor domain-containing diguanylate cyclase [Polynucleobacter sp. AM-25C3]MBU3602834.1 GGDEF domain-containing protein [Polynucleobacter sp. AM-25C3]
MDLISRNQRVARLTMMAGLTLALVFIVSAVVSAYILKQSSIQDRSEQISNLTIVLAEHASQTMYSGNTALESLVEAVSSANIQTEKAYREFASKKEQFLNLKDKTTLNTIIDVATYIGPDGKVINFSRSYPPPSIDLSDRDYFQYLSTHDSAQTYYSNPVRNKGNGKWVFYLAKRISNSKNEFLGVALIGISVEVFSSFYEKIGANLGEGSSLTLFKKDQVLLTRWPFLDERIGRKNTSKIFDEVVKNPALEGSVIFTDAQTTIRDSANVQRMISFRSVPGHPLVVAAVATEELYLASWRKSVYGILYATVLSLIFIVIGLSLLLRALNSAGKNQHLANHDHLTNLPNRLLFTDRLQQTLELAKRNKTKFALIFIDLDNLKSINDNHSHAAGDIALREAAKRMLHCVRSSDTVARIGGDEFVILLPNIESVANVLAIAEKVRGKLFERFMAHNLELVTGASMGIAIYPEHGQTDAELTANADEAMYRAKSLGRNQVCLFNPDLIKTPKS